MFQRKFKALSGNKFLSNCRGQVAILFALMMPIFLLMLGVVLDLGWYYLNVSRLQNAADAAAVAGANALREDEYFSDYKNIKLVGKYPAKDSNKYRVDSIYELTAIENTNVIAEEYVAKNLSSNEDTIINSWTKSEVASDEGLYTKDNNLYYVVKLKEEVRHFFLPGWFDDMTAPVTAVALLSKTAIKGDSTSDDGESPTMPTMPTFNSSSDDDDVVNEDQQNAIEKILNENMIVGNWEVQNHYKNNNKESDKKYYLKDEYGDFIADPETGEPTMITEFQRRFGYGVYSKAWNHFQDMANHYKVAGATYRTETINVWDDVKDTDGDGKVDSWGKEKNGENSDVVATAASTNSDKYGDKGKPYTADKLDSINVDFKPEITFVDDAAEEDWDFKLGYLTTSCNHSGSYKDWTAAQGSDVKNIGILRIHSTINIGAPYKERTDENVREKDEDGNLIPDILWGRIESEPMLFYPDNTSENFTAKDSKVGVKKGLSSIRQIIINVTESNCNEGDRPVILFYDGPETNDIYPSYESRTDVLHNKSLPVILNLNANFRGVLYAPNSPVVVMGSGNFVGFVVAKEYKRLKTTADFEDELKVDSGKYTRYEGDGKIVFTENEKVDNPYYVADSSHYASGYVAEPEKINWKYTQIEENGIKMYVDNYGNVQYMDYPDAPTKYGTYDNFGRTTFATHGYTVLKTSANNLLISGR